MRKLTLLIGLSWALVLLGNVAEAQAATHSVALTWVDASNPTGTTYNVKRSTGLCTGTPVFSTIATAVTVKTYTDSTVTPGNYCFTVDAVFNGATSVDSNLVNPNVPAFPVTLTYTVSDLLYPEFGGQGALEVQVTVPES
jgi:hypothetical protein